MFKFDLNVSAKRMPELMRLLESFASARINGYSTSQAAISGTNGRVQPLPSNEEDEVGIRDLIIFGQLPSGKIYHHQVYFRIFY